MAIPVELARIDVGVKADNNPQPHIEFKTGYDGAPTLSVSDNGYQCTVTSISVEMFDALKELVNNAKVVEHYESLRADNAK